MDLSKLSEIELLKLHSSIINELIDRNVVRTYNNPLGDFSEWLISKALNIQLMNNSKAGFDGIDNEGIKYQIKARRITARRKSKQLSAIRNLELEEFDFLIVIIFNENYEILDALKIPYEVVVKYAEYRKHVNGHILKLRGKILSESGIIDLKTDIFNMALLSR